MKKPFIIVAGNIGVGKTTLAHLIASIFEYKVYEERIEHNPYLPLFYNDKQQFAFNLQRIFLFTRVIDHEVVSNSDKPCIQDRSVYEDAEIFARNLFEQGHMSHQDYKRYRRIYDDIVKDLREPDLLIYLQGTTDLLRKRIKQRGREYEKEITKKDNPYLDQLNNLYEDWMKRYQGNKLILEADQFDFLEKPEDVESVVKKIKSSLKEEDAQLSEYI